MEGAQVFSCSTGGVRGLFNKNSGDAMFLKVENDRISGKGYVCNEDGRNGYIDEFSFSISEIRTIFVGEYMGSQALGFNAKVSNLYGAKKVQVMLPQLKNMDLVMGLLNRLKANAEDNMDNIHSAAPQREIPQQQPVSRAPEPVQQPRPEATYQQPTPVKAPTPAVTPPPAATIQQSNTQQSTAQQSNEDEQAEEFQKKMDKLLVLKDCGLLGEKEFNAKKIELVGEYFDLSDFNEKIQKLVVLKDCGLLSEKEFEANRVDIIKECCNTETSDMKEYRRSVQKLSFLELGGVISAEEYERSKQILVDDVDFYLTDSKEAFARKLKKLPVLKETQLITEKEYKQKMDNLFDMIEVSPDDEMSRLSDKLNKWPVLAQENLISQSELKEKQKTLVSNYLGGEWKTTEELQNVVSRMMALRESEWLSDMDFTTRKEDILKRVTSNPNHVERIQTYMMLSKTGLVSEADCAKQKQDCIDEIFKPCASMDEFKTRVNSLLEFQKGGIITEEEFVAFKGKLMSEL